MGKIKENSTYNQNRKFLTTCDMTYAVQLIGGRWKILIIVTLEKGPKRYGEIKKAVPGITERMLTLQLREMEEDGIVKRTVFAEVPPRVQYELTESARGLLPICDSLHEWGTGHRGIHEKQASAYGRM